MEIRSLAWAPSIDRNTETSDLCGHGLSNHLISLASMQFSLVKLFKMSSLVICLRTQLSYPNGYINFKYIRLSVCWLFSCYPLLSDTSYEEGRGCGDSATIKYPASCTATIKEVVTKIKITEKSSQVTPSFQNGLYKPWGWDGALGQNFWVIKGVFIPALPLSDWMFLGHHSSSVNMRL